MRLGVFTIFILLAGRFIPADHANAVVIKSTDTLKSNYEMHHSVVIYNNLSSYQNIQKKTFDNKQTMISQLYSTHDTFDSNKDKPISSNELEKINLTQFPISTSILETSYTYTSKERAKLFLENDQNDNYMEMPVGSFLDSFKNDPLLRTIFFTSKDLIFSYKKKIANILQLGFDMEANDYKNYHESWRNEQDTAKKRLGQKGGENMKREAGLLFGVISESYKTILYTILIILVTVYISFRYFLNKYI